MKKPTILRLLLAEKTATFLRYLRSRRRNSPDDVDTPRDPEEAKRLGFQAGFQAGYGEGLTNGVDLGVGVGLKAGSDEPGPPLTDLS